ncbi:Calcium-binding and coiled-coil domain-containing protein 2 [Cricetulus griseus]|uniref:Calcium-binding and coiled-coil domain-containing protein 2 n=1 Tax=Cricetulus griseus TaxID=10029 RepID=G3I549_CRIGR|nr:Calcium-binding and coiled-coil domain-containing protein 2 [Cricetulus griseus]
MSVEKSLLTRLMASWKFFQHVSGEVTVDETDARKDNMEKTIDEGSTSPALWGCLPSLQPERTTCPPISTDFLEHCSFSQVVFNSVDKFYVPGDVICHYTFTQQFIPHRKDWIGIYKVGWNTTWVYYTFMWIALPSDLNKESTKQQQVQFKA